MERPKTTPETQSSRPIDRWNAEAALRRAAKVAVERARAIGCEPVIAGDTASSRKKDDGIADTPASG